ncbi:hypothetical protein J7E97_12055 [Streptomyces sp. ISL-66]|uniref:hypothetical protein n=1 Tax=Streptomyces sp. ISL-66 TaxID=2819186 RepID=UPI001BE75703|nr:hypothetical protein [Streptomyces sp. ISL-66]MBT2468591.1 hypothetical protein [Streptomyces sp. ISL-66]
MHGPGIPPQHGHQPNTGNVVALRVLFTLLPILSCGFLAWGSLLRLAVVTRRSRDWWLVGASGALEVLWLVLIGADTTPELTAWQSDVGAVGTLGTGLAVCVYYLVADIRHHEQLKAARAAGWYPGPASPYASPLQQETRPSYGYPPPVAPHQPPRHAPQVPRQVPEPAPAPATPPRIGQVRAELDELSELLRRRESPNDDGPRP